MGRGKPEPGAIKAMKPKTLIQLKREERKAKKLLPRPPKPTPTPPKPRDPNVPKVVRPKPKPQNPGFQKWMALFKREITMIETHLKHSEQFRQHWRAEIDRMSDEEEKRKWESGEVGNFQRLLTMMERTREILVQAREMSAWIVPKSKLGLGKNLPGMKEFVLGAEKAKSKGPDEKANAGSDDKGDFMDTDKESGDSAPADFIPFVAKKAPRPPKDAADKSEGKTATEPAESNPFFVVDTEPTLVNLNGTSKKSKKRAKEDDGEDGKTAKKAKKEKKAVIVVPEPTSASNPKSKSAKVDFSAIEMQLQAEIEAGTKAKEDREKDKAEAKLAKKEKKRKRLSEGDSEKEVKKAKKDKKEKKKRMADGSGDEEVLSDEGGKKKYKVAE